ncbi:MAG: molybdopterin-dependent oxidoreductase [Candidatus Limnocylindrales bacterium]
MSTRTASLHPASADVPATSGRALPALAGAVSAGLAVGVSEAIAGVLPGATSLVAAIGQRVIDLQPPGAKDVVVALFGTNDKVALEVVVTLTAIAIGAGLAVLAMRRFALAAAGFVAFGALGFVAALANPNASAPTVAVQATVAAGAGLQALSSLLGRLQASSARTDAAVSDPARRSFLLRSSAVGIGAVAAGIVGRTLIERGRSAPTLVGSLPPPSVVVPPLVAGADLAPTTPGLTPIVVPNDRFYRIDTALLVPSVDVNEWTLRVHGLVDRETTLTWDELLALPQFEQYVTISCVSNEVGGNLVGNAKWTGIRLRDVLALAGVQPSATQLVGRSVDGWTAGMPLAWIMDPEREPMIAVQMNDAPLPRAHGFPARLIIPGLYGYVSATKWLTELELTTWEAFNGYWVPLGWSKEGPILTQSRIDTPRGSAQPGRVAIAGVAWAPDRGIGKVEVSIDGTWYEADLSTPITDATWVQWVVAWDATPGRHTLAVRATDGDGQLQEQTPSPPAPDGARGWHAISVNVG